MRSNTFKFMSGVIVILIPILLLICLKQELELRELKNNSANHKITEELQPEEKFELSAFLSELEEYENIEMNNIILNKTCGEVNIQCEGDLKKFDDMLKSLKNMKEITDISEVYIDKSMFRFHLVFNR